MGGGDWEPMQQAQHVIKEVPEVIINLPPEDHRAVIWGSIIGGIVTIITTVITIYLKKRKGKESGE